MSTAKTLAKLKAYKKNPNVFQSLSNEELADLVIVVLSQVRLIENAIETKKLDLDTKFSRKTEESIGRLERESKILLTQITKQVNALIAESDSVLSQTANQLEERVQKAIQNIRDGENGIVTEEEIARAASIASSLIELPNFEELVGIEITRSGKEIRDALELLPDEERYKVYIADVDGLQQKLEELARIRTAGGNGIGKNQVYNFIREAIADGTISSGGGSVSDEAYGGTWDGVTDEAPSKNAVYDKIQSLVLDAGSGNVVGPASAVDSRIAAFDGTTGKLIKDGGSTVADVLSRANHTGTQAASTISDFDTEVSNNTDVAANTAARHDAVTVADSSEIDFTLTGQQISASIISGSIDESKLDASVNASLDLADSASQPGHTHTESDITDLKNYEIKAVANGSLTAVNDTFYVCVSNSTFTDPSPTEGEGFAVLVRNGTATVGGTGYSTAGTIIHRTFHSGSWTNYVYQVSSTFATAAQGALADSAVQPGDNVSDLTNDAGYVTTSGYVPGGTDVALADGGTGASLADPNADRIMFWDDSAGAVTWLTASTGLTISGTNMTVRTASATQTGIVELATDAETVTGTDTSRATTPANITARLAAPGTIGGTTPGAATFTTVTTTGNIELGNASDTTLSRSAAGIVAVEGSPMPRISSGSGAPVSTPGQVGDIYIDTTGDDAYIAVGTASSADWEKSNDGAGGGISDGDKGDITVSSSGTVWTIDNDTIGLDELSATGTPSASTFLRGDNTWATPSGSGGTLDSSYDFGGAGAGRSITADSGAVEITIPDTENNEGLIVNQNDVTNNPTSITVINAGTGNELLLTRTTAGLTGPTLRFNFDTASPANNDRIGVLEFYGRDSASNVQRYGEIRVRSDVVTSGSEETTFQFINKDGNEVMRFDTSDNAITAGVFATGNPSIFQSNGDNDVVLRTGNATTGSITIIDGADGNINITPNGTGEAQVNGQKIIDESDVDDTPVNGATTVPVSSNWAFDHEADTSTHGVTGAIVGTTDTQTLSGKDLTATTNKLRFQKSITIESPTASEDISFFFTNNAITITEMRAVLVGSSTPSVTWTVRHGTDRSAAGAEVVTSGTTTTSTTTGSDVTSFNDATIVADSHVWVETSASSGTINSISITVFYTED